MTPNEQFEELLDLWEEMTEAGKQVTADELCRDCPDLAPELQRRIDALGQVGWVAQLAKRGGKGLQPEQCPVPGYRLVSLVGRGGFGEVWRAMGPDGVDVALKFLPCGHIHSNAERKAFENLRGIRHPNLLALAGCWESDEWLTIGMELADRSLLDRLREVRTQGREGIAPEELLGYLRQAATAIDHLHEVGIQHRDIKPQNLLLKKGEVKVADFGLARVATHTITGHSGGMTLSYAAPEFFDGKASRHSDQYSLAVTYCQLRGGRLPFDGTAAQVMAGHISREPDLTMLPEGERQVVARALAKRPEDRWENCTIFAESLAWVAAHGRPIPRNRKWVVGIAGAIVLAIGLAASLRPNNQESPPVAPPDQHFPAQNTLPEPVHQPEVSLAVAPPPHLATFRGPRFVFNGSARIITPVDRFAPVTLEAWVKPGRPSRGRQEKYVICSDIPGKSGIGISLEYRTWNIDPLLGAQLLPAPTSRGIATITPIPVGKWVHIAGSFGQTETLLFVDGTQVARGEATGTTGGTQFVIGNAGKSNPEHFFVGEMRTIRISRGARYLKDFSPSKSFEPDQSSVVIYDAVDVVGKVATDLSGNRNHGVMQGVEVQPKP